mmetsp:Transcript_73320/g.218844  ORF Transcript_73320/g.218844 Transcript_73320/m.218844 type:complete len:368 (-) Transcript_73320:735-1838(-)
MQASQALEGSIGRKWPRSRSSVSLWRPRPALMLRPCATNSSSLSSEKRPSNSSAGMTLAEAGAGESRPPRRQSSQHEAQYHSSRPPALGEGKGAPPEEHVQLHLKQTRSSPHVTRGLSRENPHRASSSGDAAPGRAARSTASASCRRSPMWRRKASVSQRPSGPKFSCVWPLYTPGTRNHAKRAERGSPLAFSRPRCSRKESYSTTDPGGTAPTTSQLASPDSTCVPGTKPMGPFKGSDWSGVRGTCMPIEAHGPGKIVSLCRVCAGAPAGVSTTTSRSNTGKPALAGPVRKRLMSAPPATQCAKDSSAALSLLKSVLFRRYRAMHDRTSGWRTSQSSVQTPSNGGTVISRPARMRLKVTPSGWLVL